MSNRRAGAWLVEAFQYAAARAGLVCFATVVNLFVSYDKISQQQQASIFTGSLVYVALMTIADVPIALTRRQPAAFTVPLLAAAALLGFLASLFTSTLNTAVCCSIANIPILLLQLVQLIFGKGGTYANEQFAAGESWITSELSGARTVVNFAHDDQVYKHPDAHVSRWWDTREVYYERADEVPVWRSARVIVTMGVTTAEVLRDGTFRVTRRNQMRFTSDPDKLSNILRFLPVSQAKQVVIECPIENVRRFLIGAASELELATPDQANFRAGKLRFTEHNLIRVELANSKVTTISRDFWFGKEHAEATLLRLTQEFKPPGIGWAAALAAARGETRVTPQGHDPI